MERQHLVIIFLAAVIVTLPFLRVTPQFYTSDANVYFHTASLLLQEQSFSTDEVRKGWIDLGDRYYPAMPIGYSIFSLPFASLFLLDAPVQRGQIEPASGLHKGPPGMTGFWMSDEATLRIERDATNNVLLSFQTRSFPLGEKNLTILQGGKVIHTSTHGKNWDSVLVPFTAFEGQNTLTLRASGCENVTELLPSTGITGCTSFLLKNFWIGDHEVSGFSFDDVSYPVWVSADATTLTVENPSTVPGRQRLNFDVRGYSAGNATLAMEVRGHRYEWRIPTSGREIVTPAIRFPPNSSNLTFQTASPRSGCYEVSDGRCIYFAIDEIGFEQPLQEAGVMFTGEWYEKDPTDHRWAAGPAGMRVGEAARRVTFKARSFQTSRTLQIYRDGTPRRQVDLPTDWKTVSVDLPSSRSPHSLRFRFSGRCRTPAEVGSSKDRRCLGWAVRDVEVN
ncbi:MAG: hypothetical protein ABEI97_00235 [Candidatus Nanohaloarchaea archaeon]